MKESEHEISIELLHHGSLHAEEIRTTTPVVVTAQRIVNCRCRLGEGILFDANTSSILWTDIYGKRLHRLRILEESTIEEAKTRIKALHSTYTLPKQLCSFGLLDVDSSDAAELSSTSRPLTLLCAWEDGFSVYDVEKECAVSETSRGPNVRPNGGATRLNDGRVDPRGTRFVCGGFFGETADNYEKVFSVGQRVDDGELYHTAIVDRIQTTNSINWSLDGARMYLADSVSKTIWTYDYDPESSSALSDRQVLCQYSAEESFVPDGSCVDAEGYLWNAVWSHSETSSGKVHRIHPTTGEVVLIVQIPDAVSQVSCCCFGGPNLDTLFITTACDGTDITSQPHAGAVYAVKLPYRGRPESRFQYSLPKR